MRKNGWTLRYKELKLTRNEKGYLLSTQDNEASIVLENKNLKFTHQQKPIQEDTEQYKEAMAQYLINNYEVLLQIVTSQE